MRRLIKTLAAVLAVLMVVSIMPFKTTVNAATTMDRFSGFSALHKTITVDNEECKIDINYNTYYFSVLYIVFRCEFSGSSTEPKRSFSLFYDPETKEVRDNQCTVSIFENNKEYTSTLPMDINYDPNATYTPNNLSSPSNMSYMPTIILINRTVSTSMLNVDSLLRTHSEISLGNLGFNKFAKINKTIPDIKPIIGPGGIDKDFFETLVYSYFNKTVTFEDASYNVVKYLNKTGVTYRVYFDTTTCITLEIPFDTSKGRVMYRKDIDSYNDTASSPLPADYNPKTSNLYFTYVYISCPTNKSVAEMNKEANELTRIAFQIAALCLLDETIEMQEIGFTAYNIPLPTPIPDTTDKDPTKTPTTVPPKDPTGGPTKTPTTVPPTVPPTKTPTVPPTKTPTLAPTKAPATTNPTVTPTKAPATTAKPTVKPTAVPSKTPTASPAPSTSADNGVGGFIDRLYTVALGRDFDEGGKNYWTDEIKFNGKNGADIAYQFLYSEEFLGKNMSQDDFLTVLYRTFFDREPDAGGLKYWKDQMSAGQTKEWVIAGFINSEEWANICLSYGIPSGSSVAPTITIVPNEQVIGFATRLYTTCLKRDFDPEGLDFWAKELANLRRTGSEAAKGFFFSDELNKSGISDAEFLTRLYKTLMNREPEKDGFDYWLGQMKSGAMSRESVFDGFAASKEWAEICADYGILR